MATTFAFELTLLFNQQVDDAAGNWQFAGAVGVEQTTRLPVQLLATKRTNALGSTAFPASMLTATLLFPSEGEGAAPNMTLQGIHDLTTNDESGSVSAASALLFDQIGGTFVFDAASGVLTISPPAC